MRMLLLIVFLFRLTEYESGCNLWLFCQVADFGLARWHAEWNTTIDERVVGTSGYIPNKICTCYLQMHMRCSLQFMNNLCTIIFV